MRKKSAARIFAPIWGRLVRGGPGRGSFFTNGSAAMIVEPDFVDHWKTRTLVSILGGDELAPIYILRLWSHCQQRKQWVFQSLPPAALAGICHFLGDPAIFDAAMVQSGWTSRDGSCLTANGWDEYNASLIAAWENGKRGGRPSKNNPAVNQGGNPRVNPIPENGDIRLTHGVTDKIRVEEIREENTNAPPASKGAYSPDFEQWWLIYPKKASKGAAAKAFPNAVKRIGIERQLTKLEAFQWLLKITKEFADSPKVKTFPADKLLHPATWLNGAAWDDDRTLWQSPYQSNGNGHKPPDQFGVRKPKTPMVPVPLPGQTETIFERQAREDRITDLKEFQDGQ